MRLQTPECMKSLHPKMGGLHSARSLPPQATAVLSLRRNTVWHGPVDTRVYESPSSKGGMVHCPKPLYPQAAARPSNRTSTVWNPPADTWVTWVYEIPASKDGRLHSPRLLPPQATAVPSLRRSTVRHVDTRVYEAPSSKDGKVHCPKPLYPQATARPSFRTSTVWNPPADTWVTWVYEIPASKDGRLHSPRLLPPQATAVPSLRRSTLRHGPPKMEWCIVQSHCIHKLRHDHRFEQALYEMRLQTPECMKSLHPKMGGCIVPVDCLHKLRQFHHFEEALCDTGLEIQKCMKALLPKVECCIVPQHFACRLQYSHHLEEGQCAWCRHIPLGFVSNVSTVFESPTPTLSFLIYIKRKRNGHADDSTTMRTEIAAVFSTNQTKKQKSVQVWTEPKHQLKVILIIDHLEKRLRWLGPPTFAKNGCDEAAMTLLRLTHPMLMLYHRLSHERI